MSNKKNTRMRDSLQSKRLDRFFPDLSAPMIFCAAEALVLLFTCILLLTTLKTEKNAEIVYIICYSAIPVYIFSAGPICLIYALRAKKTKKARLDGSKYETEVYDIFRSVIDIPYAVSDGAGNVKIFNGALQDILGFKNAVSGIELDEFCSVDIKTIIATAKNKEAFLEEEVYDMPEQSELNARSLVTRLADSRRYKVDSYVIKMKEENYYFIVFRDVEDLLSLREKYEEENTVVAYILLDNLQALTQYVRADYRAASAEAENILKEWIGGMKGFIKENTKDKYIAVFSQDALEEQIKNEFAIQKKIMAMDLGDNSFPVTVSMGISAIGDSLEEKERNAQSALDMAIGRGGNQVAIRREDTASYIFFGGTHKTMENNTAIISRVSGDILENKLRTASNVIIMGHSNPDFDSIGSCVGMARFVMACTENDPARDGESVPVNIVVNKSTDSFETCRAQLSPMNIYEDIFVDREVAKDLVSSDTVLIICDVNNPHIYEAPELVNTVRSIAMFDHHRLSDTPAFETFIQYVESTKSSASEIVAEIIMRSGYAESLHKEEAEVLLSGIMLDTSNFTRNAGAQTFEITHYLYSRGAHTAVVREFFSESLEEIMLTGEFESKARIYREDVAITWMTLEREDVTEDRVLAAKVADHLLHVKGVKASFALVKTGNDVVISGRSSGEINVQLILERLKGGGHFDIAGAQIKDASLTRSCELLKSAIDDYYEYDHHNN